MNLSTTFASLRKQVAGISLITLVAGMFATGVATAATTTHIFSDVPADAWYATYVHSLADMGVVDSTSDMYRPGDLVNRAEMAKWAFFVSGLPLETSTAAPYKDVPMGQWYTNYIYTLTKNGIVSGDKKDGVPTGWFRPSDALNRAEATKMLVNAAQMAEDLSGAPHFPDVHSSDWYYNFVETAFNNGVVAGYPDGQFRPANNINRAEAAKMVYLSMNPASTGFTLDSAAASSKTTVELIFSQNVDESSAEMASHYEITDASGNDLNVTGAVMVAPDTVDLTTATQTENTTYEVVATDVTSEAGDALANNDSVSFLGYGSDVSGGDLKVSLSTETPVAGSVPSGATGVIFTCWDFQANGSDAAMIKSLHVHRVGPGPQTDFSNVYLYNGDQRLTTGRSINSETQMVEFNNINQTVAAGQNMKLCLVADMVGGASGGVHAFELTAAGDVLSNSSDMTGSFPLRGADQLITSATVGTTTIRKNGSLDEVTVGEKDARIAQFELEADGKEDQSLNRIALYIRGSVTVSDLKNFRLYAEDSDTILATEASVGAKDLVTLTLTKPYKIGRGEKKIFHVLADLSPGRDGDKIKTYLDENTDLNVTGNTFGYGTKIVSTVFDGSGTCPGVGCNASYVNIKGSTFNVSFTGPLAGEVAVGQKAARCLDLTITNGSGSSVEIKDWVVKMTTTDDALTGDETGLYGATGAANFTLIKLTEVNDDGSTGGSLLGPAELSAEGGANTDASSNVTLTGSATIDAGQSINTSVVFDVANNALATGTKVRCSLQNLTTTSDSVRDENGDFLTGSSITPSSDIVGNLMTETASALKVSAASTPSSTSYSRGSSSVPLLGIQFKAGSALDETVKSVTITGNATVGTLKDIIDSNVALYDSPTGGSPISDFKNITSDATPTITFNNLNIAIPKNGTKTVYLRGNVSNSASPSIVRFFIVNSTDVIAIDQNGQTSSGVDVSSIDTMAEVPAMTVGASGTGSVGQSTVNKTYVAAASKTFEASRYKFSAKDGQATLQDLDIAIANHSSSSVQTVKLQKLDNATSTCTDFAGGAALSPNSNGLAEFNNIGLDLGNTADTTLCVIVTTNPVQSTGEPTSGSNVGAVLFNVTEVSSGSGNNVAPVYAGDFDLATTGIQSGLVVGSIPASGNAGSFTVTGIASGSNLVSGDVIAVDDELIRYTGTTSQALAGGLTFDSTAAFSYQRGFANSTVGGHGAGAVVTRSTVAVASATAATVAKGDIYSNGVTYMLALVANPTDPDGADNVWGYDASCNVTDLAATVDNQASCLPFGDHAMLAAADAAGTAADQTKFSLHGPVSKLYRSVPTLTLNALPSSILSSTTVLSAFKITPENSTVTFNNDVDAGNASELVLHYTQTGATPGACTLKEVGGSDVDTTIAAGGLIAFDFADQGSPYTVSGPTDFQVECVIAGIVNPSSISTFFTSVDDPLKWNDGNVEVTGAGTALFPSSTTAQVTSSNS